MKRFQIIMLVAVFLSVGCSDSTQNATTSTTGGEGGGGAGGTGETPLIYGVAKDKSSKDLTTAERDMVCAGLAKYYADNGVYAADCKLEGYTWAELTGSMDNAVLRDACTMRYDSCMKERLSLTSVTSNLCSPASNCTGTVAEGVACVAGVGDDRVTTCAGLPECSQITFADLSLPGSLQYPPAPECASFNATCTP